MLYRQSIGRFQVQIQQPATIYCWLPSGVPSHCRRARRSSSSSSKRWQTRQGRDKYAISARVDGLKSRAAYKLLEINERYRIFKPGQTVVDLGFAPGSWSQVAVDRTSPHGLVVGIDVIPAQPPNGVSTIQGNFLSAAVQESVKNFLRESQRGVSGRESSSPKNPQNGPVTESEIASNGKSYLEHGEQLGLLAPEVPGKLREITSIEDNVDHAYEGIIVDVVLSDMMMNTSGINFKDHAGSMDLCEAALKFAFDTLRPSGHFVCKFYQGSEDKLLEARLKKLFSKVHRDKPESSRNESREAFFVALRRKPGIRRLELFGEVQIQLFLLWLLLDVLVD